MHSPISSPSAEGGLAFAENQVGLPSLTIKGRENRIRGEEGGCWVLNDDDLDQLSGQRLPLHSPVGALSPPSCETAIRFTPGGSGLQCTSGPNKNRISHYRTLKQKGLTDGSAWTLYKKMDSLENPSSQTTKEASDTTGNGTHDAKNLFPLMGNGKKSRASPPLAWDAGDRPDDQTRAFRSFSSSSAARFFGLKQENSAIGELTDAIRSFGDGFIRLEQTKMEVMREMERMRMEMEKKRTKMIIESQQQIAEVFIEAICTVKKLKRMSSPDS